MTATDELRALLDERGVKHFDHEEGEPLRDLSEAGPDPATSWLIGNASVCAVPNKNGMFDLWIDHVTPAQAIDATLGRGTCHDTEKREGYFACSECGYEFSSWGGFGCDYGDDPDFAFCPCCGRRVIDAGDVDG